MPQTKEQKRLKHNEYMRKWKHEHPEAVEIINKKYYYDNPDKVWDWAAISDARWKVKAFIKLGCKCRRCGEDNPLILTINHINGGGKEDRKHISTEGMCRQIVKGRDDLELLCHNCQKLYEYETGRISQKRADIFLAELESQKRALVN